MPPRLASLESLDRHPPGDRLAPCSGDPLGLLDGPGLDDIKPASDYPFQVVAHR